MYRLLHEKSKLHSVFFIIVLMVCISCFAGCSSGGGNASKNSIIYGLTLEPSGIDPHRNQSAELGIVLRQVYDTLVYRDPDTREIVPGLATAWTISEDGMAYTFTLRQGVKFHDDTPFNAQAVAANIDRIIDPETLSQKALFLLGPYGSYEILDEYTIVLHMNQPYSPLLDSLSQVYLGIASPKALQEYSLNRYQFHQVGTGPYKFIEYTTGDKIVLQRNEEYTWGPAFYEPMSENTPDEITYRFFADAPTRALALESGDAQIMGEIPPVDARALTGNSDIRLVPVELPGQPVQFFMNVEQYPTDNLVVRQALLYGTNRNVIVDTIFQGFSPVAWGPLSAVTQYYNREVFGMYTYDGQQARALLASVGFSDEDNNGFLDVGDGDFAIKMIVPGWGSLPEVAQLIQSQWRELGINVELVQVPGFAALREAVEQGDYNLVAFDVAGFDPVVLNSAYITDGSNNYSNFSNLELDNVLLQASRETNPATRRNLYGQVQKYIMDNALILPIRDYVNLNATSSNIQNLRFDPYGWFPIMNNVTVGEGETEQP